MDVEDVTEVALFGGAMRCRVPRALQDVSRFRQVPDHQEVLHDLSTGAVLIVELLARRRELADAAAGRFFYDDLARANGCGGDGAGPATLAALPPGAYAGLAGPGGCAYGCLATGTQRIAKFAHEDGRENDVFVGLAVLRLGPPAAAEVLVSLSCPAALHPSSSDAAVVERLLSPGEREAILRTVLKSLEVRDWGLFVPEEEEEEG